MATKTVKQTVLSLVKRGWKDYIDIEDAVYPADGMRRLRELRADGVNIVKKYNSETGTFQYRVK